MAQCHSCKRLRIEPVLGNAYVWCEKALVAFVDSECRWYEERVVDEESIDEEG